MYTLLRITLLTVCTATGIAVAVAVALQPPPATDKPGEPAVNAKPVSAEAIKPHAAPPAVLVTPQDAAPLQPPHHDLVARQVSHLETAIQEAEQSAQRREWSLLRAISSMQERLTEVATQQTAPPPAPLPLVAPAQLVQRELEPPPAPLPSESLPEARERIEQGEGDETLTINVQNSDIRQVLEQLNQHSGLNIMAAKSVQGTVTANLTNVSVETALAAILKTTGYVARREGDILYIGTPAELALMDQTQDRIATRVYRPNYIKALDLQALITPMLTPEIGHVTVSSPSEVDIPADQTKTGGNSFAGSDVVVVRDYEAVLFEVDQIFAEVDVKPQQVAIEAMILSVNLSDQYQLGVNFAALLDSDHTRIVSGSPLTNLANIDLTTGGLKFGFLDANLAVFIDALETIGDTNVIASPRLTCLNKQRAEIQIGEELGYVSTTVTETTATQTVNFLDVGTLLRIRPFIGNDGLIRLEVHPELSTGTVTIDQGLSLPNKTVTQVTTNVLCPDGCTVVIGGLIREDLQNDTTQIPLLGNLPWVGPVFRQKTERVDRNEIIVLITPRIVSEPFMCEEGAKYGNDFTQRQSVYFDKMSPIAKRNLGLFHLRKARAAYAAGDYLTALKEVNRSIHFDPLARDAIGLRNEIIAAGGFHDESIHEYLNRGLPPLSGGKRDYSKQGFPWKEFEGIGPPEVAATGDPGQVGPARTIVGSPPVPARIRLSDDPLPIADPLPHAEEPIPSPPPPLYKPLFVPPLPLPRADQT